MSVLIVLSFGYYIISQISPSDKTHLSGKEIKALLKRTGTGYYFQQCNCIKHKTRSGESSSSPTRLKSTCSDEADWYGVGQNVVSYVLHHDKEKDADPFSMFVNGIIPNIYQVRQLYPGWTLRFYTDEDLTQDFCDFACMDEVMWCDIRELTFANLTNVNFRMWRFMAIGDPTVEKFVSRDIDSFITEREREAVTDWEISSKPFHLMRDSGTHHGRAILAGMWGAKNYILNPSLSVGLRDIFVKNGTNNTAFSHDEDILEEQLFKKYESMFLAHDSYNCKKYWRSAVPYPKQRKNKYTRIALSILVIHKFVAPPCPEECRPSYGKDWTYC